MQSEPANINADEQVAAPAEGALYLFDRAALSKKNEDLKGFPQLLVKEDSALGGQIFTSVSDSSASVVVARRSTPDARQIVDDSLRAAESFILSFALDRQLRTARQQKFQIESNLIIFNSSEERTVALELQSRKAAEASAALVKAGPPKYAQAVRAMRDYARAEVDFVAQQPSGHSKTEFARQAVINLETMMPNVDNLYKAVSGHECELSRIDLSQEFDGLSRLTDLHNHLHARLEFIDASNQRRNSKLVQENTVLADLNTRISSLPSDGAIFFFNSKSEVVKGVMTFEGKLIGEDGAKYRQDALLPDGTVRGANGPVRVRKTFKAVDILRWQRYGIDMNGAGIDRFKHDDVVGAVIVRPKQDAKGRPIEIRRQGKPNGGKPSIAKEVVEMFGTVPAEVKPGMSLGNLMKRFDPDR